MHKEGGLALRYSDGYGLYMLNGVAVPDWLVLKKDTEIEPAEILKIDNAEVRREFVRKVGYERIFYKLDGKTLDKKEIMISNGREMFQHKYEVVQLDKLNWTALKMINPSLSSEGNEVYHIEGLPPGCDTVEKAINFRKPDKMKAMPVSEDGDSYYQHGDRVIWPLNATKLKMYPTILT